MPNMSVADLPVSMRLLQEDEADSWMEAHLEARGPEELRRLSMLWHGAKEGKGPIWTAWREARMIGHAALLFHSHYPAFARRGIPEIVDLWVHPEARRQNIATRLLECVETSARETKCPAIGLGVGVTADYGAAHALYAVRGYRPDGMGLWARGRPTQQGDSVTLDDSAVMMWVKDL